MCRRCSSRPSGRTSFHPESIRASNHPGRPVGPQSFLKGDISMTSKLLAIATLAATIPFVGLAHAQAGGPYNVLKIQLVGGDGGFDYVTADPDGRNLFVARSGQIER